MLLRVKLGVIRQDITLSIRLIRIDECILVSELCLLCQSSRVSRFRLCCCRSLQSDIGSLQVCISEAGLSTQLAAWTELPGDEEAAAEAQAHTRKPGFNEKRTTSRFLSILEVLRFQILTLEAEG